jgi:tetraacyldisaccharide 4'-kinase
MTTASSILLAPLATLYGAITQARLALYRRGILNVSKLDAPVISVGNLTTGGTGKTPLVEYVARVIAAEGQKACVLTRGYGRESPRERVLVSDGVHVLADENEAGDEPRLLAENLQGLAAVVSDANRFAAGRWAIAELGSEVLVLDDGFQHVQLARDLNVAVVDAIDAWAGGHLLPRGRLREPRTELTRADCIVITRADQADDIDSLKREIEKVSNNRTLFTSRMRVTGLRPLHEKAFRIEAGPKPEIASPVAVFCAIGNPPSFIKQVEQEGYDVVAVTRFPDHHKYDLRDVGSIVEKAKMAGARSLITTAKDAVKLRDLCFEIPCYVLDIEICLDEETRFVEMIHAAIARKSPTTSSLSSIE